MHENLSLSELRQMWSEAWGRKPHARIGRTMLQRSLNYKIGECENYGLTSEQCIHLEQLIKHYKSRPISKDLNVLLKPGTRLVRAHEGKKHSVLVKVEGFEYQGQVYNSLSRIANEITGKRWNGWVFFGLKKAGAQ